MKRAPLFIALAGVLAGLGLLALVVWLQMRPAPLAPEVPRASEAAISNAQRMRLLDVGARRDVPCRTLQVVGGGGRRPARPSDGDPRAAQFGELAEERARLAGPDRDAMRSVNHIAPFGPAAMRKGTAPAVGTLNSLMRPSVVMRPIAQPEAITFRCMSLPTTLAWRSNSVTVSTKSVAVTPSRRRPVSSMPTTSGVSR